MIHQKKKNTTRHFYPRSPCGERRQRGSRITYVEISIHALLAESDNRGAYHIKRNENFYPRSPCGERLVVTAFPGSADKFLSTLSLRRATPSVMLFNGRV